MFDIIRKTIEQTTHIVYTIFSLIIEIIISLLKWLNNFVRFESIAADKLNLILERINEMKLNLDTLAAEVARVQTVQASAVTLLKGLAGDLTDVSAKLTAALAAANVPPEAVDTSELDALVEKLKDSTDDLAAAVADSADIKPTHGIVLHAEDASTPTVEVVLPEVLPELVIVKTEKVVDEVDVKSEEPQYVITVEPVSEEVVKEENVVTEVIKTEDHLVDVVVVAHTEEAEELKAEGVDVLELVKEAYEAQPDVEAAPVAEPLNTDHATTPETGGAPSAGAAGTQSGPDIEGSPV